MLRWGYATTKKRLIGYEGLPKSEQPSRAFIKHAAQAEKEGYYIEGDFWASSSREVRVGLLDLGPCGYFMPSSYEDQ